MRTKIVLGTAMLLMFTLVSLFATTGAAPADTKHRVVMQVTSENAEQWDGVLNNIENVREALGPDETRVAVIVHGKGLGMVTSANSDLQARMKTLADTGRVTFTACENTMKRKGVTRNQLLPFVEVVDSGIAEVVRKQEQGWAYIKAGS